MTNIFFIQKTGADNPLFGVDIGSFSAPTFADIDGDSDLDVIVGTRDGTLKYYKNTGSSTAPIYTVQTGTANPFNGIDIGSISAPTFADLDGDGDLDAIIGATDGTLYYYKNTGNNTAPAYTVQTGTANPFNGIDVWLYSAPSLADLDGDGDLDAIIGTVYGNLSYYKNTGSNIAPIYIVQTGTANPFSSIDTGSGSLSKPSLADLDGDGDLDAIIGAYDGTLDYFKNIGSSTVPIYIQQGPSRANPFKGIDVEFYSAPTLADLDGDGDLDAIIGGLDGNLNYFQSVALIAITQTGGNTQVTEGGATDSYAVILSDQPIANVVITFKGSTQLSANVTTLTFTPANWNIAQTVIVTAINDTIGEGPHRGVITATSSSNDSRFNTILIDPIQVTIADNDLPTSSRIYVAQTGTANPFNSIDLKSDRTPTFVDLDGDGDLDAIVGALDGNLNYYKNTGSSTAPVYTEQTGTANPFNVINVGFYSAPTFADLDGDGDLDAIIGESFGNLNYYKNTGSSTAPVYTEQIGKANPFNGIDVKPFEDNFSKPILADIDDDGDLDAIIGTQDGTLNYYKNTGSSTALIYTVQTGTANPFNEIDTGSNSAPSLADLDGDGDLDAIVGKNDGNLNYYRNTGSSTAPVYTIQTGATNPFNGINVRFTSAPTFADLDGDGDLDAIVGSGDLSLNYFLSVEPIAITQTGGNTQVNEGGATDTFTLVLNAQPIADVVITFKAGTQLSPNVTTLTFTTVNWNISQTVTVTAIDDTVGEGTNFGVITASSSSTDTRFNAVTIAPIQVTIADNDLPNTSRIYVAQVGADKPFNGINVGSYSAPTLADLDGDGDLDAIVGKNDGTLNYYKNTGSSTAPVYTIQTGATNPFNGIDVGVLSTPTLADIDGDGDLDAIVGAGDGTLNYYKNTGSSTAPTYTEQTGTPNPFNSINVGSMSAPTLADLDGDGDLDAIVGAYDGTLNYYKNTGSSTAPVYTEQTGTASPFNGIDVGYFSKPTFADLDGDGDLDAIIGEYDGTLNYYKNTGSITTPIYTVQTGTANPLNGINVGSYSAPTFADIDSDGDLDAVIGELDGTLNYFQSVVPNTAPVISSATSTSFAENASGVAYTVIATDTSAITYGLTGLDASLFSINSSTGEIRFNAAPDFESPADSGGNNVYDINVTASDGALDSSLAVAITVTDLAEFSGVGTRNNITGTAGNDYIVGGSGAKLLTGGAGNDQFVFTNSRDVGQRITDFTISEDKIVLTGLLANVVYTGSNPIADGFIRFIANAGVGGGSFLQLDRDGLVGSAIFRNFVQVDTITPANLNNVNNFIF